MSYPKIELRFHPNETEYPITYDYGNCTIVEDSYRYHGKLYKKLEYQFEYYENPAIGCGWCLCPRAPCLGYHLGDQERIILLQNLDTKDIDHVYFNAHGRGQGVWREWHECEKTSDGNLIAYVARGSHAFYPHSGIYLRIFGLANDHCSTSGRYIISEVNGMHSYDDSLANTPPERSITPCQRFFLPFVLNKIRK